MCVCVQAGNVVHMLARAYCARTYTNTHTQTRRRQCGWQCARLRRCAADLVWPFLFCTQSKPNTHNCVTRAHAFETRTPHRHRISTARNQTFTYVMAADGVWRMAPADCDHRCDTMVRTFLFKCRRLAANRARAESRFSVRSGERERETRHTMHTLVAGTENRLRI